MARSLHASRHLCCPCETPSISRFANDHSEKLRVAADNGGSRRHQNVAVRVATIRSFSAAKIPAVLGLELETLGSISEFVVSHGQLLQESAVNMITELHLSTAIENAFANCEYTTLLAVDGSMPGFVLCLIGICRFVSSSYLRSFKFLSGNPVGVYRCMFKMIQAFDIVLLGTAMVVFGFGTYPIFIPSEKTRSPLCREGYRKTFSVLKNKIGNVVFMTIQVAFLEKLKHLRMVSGGDLTCLLATVLIFSITLLLSKPDTQDSIKN